MKMNFEEYRTRFQCEPLAQTEQSWAFTVTKDGEKRVVKMYPSTFDRCREELAYAYLNAKGLLRIPKLYFVGEDFIEIQFLEKEGDLTIKEIIAGIAKMYRETHRDSHPKGYFPKLDLSKDKLFYRLEYIPKELEKRGVLDTGLISMSRRFVESEYQPSQNQCLVHGDLKSPHIIKTKDGTFYIDLALLSVASPWYDLAFSFMEHRDRRELLPVLSSAAFELIGSDLGATQNEVTEYLKSAIFYRSLYDVGFAARHRSDKPLARTIKDLKEILEGKVY